MKNHGKNSRFGNYRVRSVFSPIHSSLSAAITIAAEVEFEAYLHDTMNCYLLSKTDMTLSECSQLINLIDRLIYSPSLSINRVHFHSSQPCRGYEE